MGTGQGLVFRGTMTDHLDTVGLCQGSTGSTKAWRIMPGQRGKDAECPWVWPPIGARR